VLRGKDVVIVGNNVAVPKVIKWLRAYYPRANIHIICRERVLGYSRYLLPYLMAYNYDVNLYSIPRLYLKYIVRCNVYYNYSINDIDRDNKVIHINNGKESKNIKYDKLIVALDFKIAPKHGIKLWQLSDYIESWPRIKKHNTVCIKGDIRLVSHIIDALIAIDKKIQYYPSGDPFTEIFDEDMASIFCSFLKERIPNISICECNGEVIINHSSISYDNEIVQLLGAKLDSLGRPLIDRKACLLGACNEYFIGSLAVPYYLANVPDYYPEENTLVKRGLITALNIAEFSVDMKEINSHLGKIGNIFFVSYRLYKERNKTYDDISSTRIKLRLPDYPESLKDEYAYIKISVDRKSEKIIAFQAFGPSKYSVLAMLGAYLIDKEIGIVLTKDVPSHPLILGLNNSVNLVIEALWRKIKKKPNVLL